MEEEYSKVLGYLTSFNGPLSDLIKLNGLDYIDLENQDYDDSEITLDGAKKPEEVINEIIIDLLSDDKLPPWKQSWGSGGNNILAQNFTTKTPYTGANAVLLNVIFGAQAPSPYYLTFTQIKSLKGKLNEGSKGYPIIFYSFTYKIKSENQIPGIKAKVIGKQIFLKKKKYTITEDNYTVLNLTEKAINDLGLENNEYYSVGFLRYYRVFNIADTDIEYTLPESRNNNSSIELAEKIWELYPSKPKLEFNKDDAKYNRQNDIIYMPKIEQFNNAEEYYTTLFHEMIHSTGIASRTDRFKNYEGKDKDAQYAFEELVAELGAAYLAGYAGILNVVKANTASYIKNWHEVLIKQTQSNANFIIEASKQAQKAVEYIIPQFLVWLENNSGEQKEESKEKEKEKARARARLLKMKLKMKLKLKS